MKSLKPTDQLEIEIPDFKHPDFRPWAAMVLSVIAVVISMFGIIRSNDDTELRAAYEAQSRSVKELSLQIQELNLEVAVLRGYAEAQGKSLTVAVPVKPGASAVPAASFDVKIPLRVVPFKDVKPDEWTVPVPAARPIPKPIIPPPFDSLKDEKK